jgi:FdhD protein
VEEPLEIRINGRSIAVIMRTPGADEELAAGFLLSEGMVRKRQDVLGTRVDPRNAEGNVLDVVLGPKVSVDFKRLTRHVFGASSCGLCGKSSIEAVRAALPAGKVRASGKGAGASVSASTLMELPDRMRAAQAAFGRTGGLHAAALFDLDGGLIGAREDVGRHNAVDKLIGRAFWDDELPLERRVLVVSGRASFEILQKAWAGGISIIAAVGAPSSLAVDFARGAGQTLIGFLRDGRFNVYAGAKRVRG